MPDTLQRFYAHRGGETYPLAHYKEAASQSFKAGDLVTLSGGKVAALATSDGDVTSAGNKVLGMALKDASGVTDTLIPVVPATDDTWFLLGAYNAAAGSAKPSNIAIGEKTTIRRQGGVYGVNVPAAGSNQNVQVVAKESVEEETKYGPVWVKVLAASRVLE